MNDPKTKNLLVALAAAVAFAVPGAVFADETPAIAGKSAKVTLADLDINNQAGAEALYARMKRATKEVCGVDNARKVRFTSARSDAWLCYRNTLSAAVRELNNDLITSIHEGK